MHESVVWIIFVYSTYSKFYYQMHRNVLIQLRCNSFLHFFIVAFISLCCSICSNSVFFFFPLCGYCFLFKLFSFSLCVVLSLAFVLCLWLSTFFISSLDVRTIPHKFDVAASVRHKIFSLVQHEAVCDHSTVCSAHCHQAGKKHWSLRLYRNLFKTLVQFIIHHPYIFRSIQSVHASWITQREYSPMKNSEKLKAVHQTAKATSSHRR